MQRSQSANGTCCTQCSFASFGYSSYDQVCTNILSPVEQEQTPCARALYSPQTIPNTRSTRTAPPSPVETFPYKANGAVAFAHLAFTPPPPPPPAALPPPPPPLHAALRGGTPLALLGPVQYVPGAVVVVAALCFGADDVGMGARLLTGGARGRTRSWEMVLLGPLALVRASA